MKEHAGNVGLHITAAAVFAWKTFTRADRLDFPRGDRSAL
jgi:hypothetical protein